MGTIIGYHVFVYNQTICCFDNSSTKETTSLREANVWLSAHKHAANNVLQLPLVDTIPLSSTSWCTERCWSPFPSSSPLFICSYLQQFVEVFDVTFLDLLRGDLRLFEMDVLIVKCLKKERNSVMESVLTQALFEASTCFQRLQLPNHRLPEGVIRDVNRLFFSTSRDTSSTIILSTSI